MNKILKSVGGVLLGMLLVLAMVFAATEVRAVDFGVSNIAAYEGGIGNTIDPCLNSGGAFGFVFCPAVDVFASVIDHFLSTMENDFNWGYLVDSGGSDGLKVSEVWSRFLPVANVLFALVFLVVIYSVATGQGLNNYSIKKIMPRLILIAVAINVSYYICAALIDISNIVGASIYDLVFDTLSGGANGRLHQITFTELADSVFANSGSGANLVGATNPIGALLMLVVNMAVVLLGIGAVFVGVAARNVILMMLLLSAPLAFTTALLPNTENIFRKWGNNFLRLLVIYPAFMLVWAICRALQAVFLDSDASTLDLILAMLLSVAPAITIIPLFKGTGGLTGKVANLVQRGSAGFAPSSVTNNQTTNNKANSQNIDQINQKKFTTDKSIKTTNANSRDGGVQNTFSDESNSVLNSRTTEAANQIGAAAGAKAVGGKSKRSRALSANLKSQVDVSNAQKAVNSSLNSIHSNTVSNTINTNVNNASNASNVNSSNATSNQTSNASNLSRSRASQNSNNLVNQALKSSVTNNSNSNSTAERKIDLNGEFDKLADVIKAKNQGQPLTRERAAANAKAAPVLGRQSFVEKPADDKKSQKTFDVSSKSPMTNVFAGDGQQVSIENSGETSQLVEQKILDGSAMVDGAPSIVPESIVPGDDAGQAGESESDDEAVSAPSIVRDVISDNDRRDRFVGEAGQKELAKLLTATNIKLLLPSDIDYVLGIGPLLSTDGEELSPSGDISGEPEYTAAAGVVAGWISTLGDDEKNGADVMKWQKQLGLL
jgi:hypothetical protein